MNYGATDAKMNETDFEMKVQEQNYQNPDFFDKQRQEYNRLKESSITPQ